MTPSKILLVVAAMLAALLPVGAAAEPPVQAGRFIITVVDGANPSDIAADYARRGDAVVGYVYEHALKGFAADLTERGRSALMADNRIAAMERDAVATISQVQDTPPWGLDRSDQAALPLDDTYIYDTTGAGVTAYVVDTGIRASHADFGGRVNSSAGYDAFGGTGDDCHGHGSHVAGTIGGTEFGMAKGVTLVPVRVLDCNGSGPYSAVIAGVDYVAANAPTAAVANMSLGGPASSALDAAIANAVALGTPFVVAAGNDNRDACRASPAREASAITVGATDVNDRRASFSNFGTCLDLFAPGVSIESVNYTGGSISYNGTSMASPHVAGAVARHLEAKPDATPTQLSNTIVGDATDGVVANRGRRSPNLLLFIDGGGQSGGNQAPTASFTSSCSGLTCTFDASASSDSDGTVTTYLWTLGDGAQASGEGVTHEYAASGTYTVALSVTDDQGASDDASATVTVSDGTQTLTASASGFKVKGIQHADITWSGAMTSNVVIVRDDAVEIMTPNDGAYTDEIGNRGGGSYSYVVCEAGTSTCSAPVTVNF